MTLNPANEYPDPKIDEAVGREIYTVSRLNREARALLADHLLSIWVDGEISILAYRSSDHVYFTLKQMSIAVEDERVIRLPIYYGGPVQPERGFVIHPPKGKWDSSPEVSASISMMTSRHILEAIAMGEGPDRFVVALGYAGWGEVQLEREIMQNAWLNAR